MHPQYFTIAFSICRCAHLVSPIQCCLSGLPWYFLWKGNASNDRSGLAIHSIWAPRRKQGTTPTSSETMTPCHFLRLSISLFLGIVCAGSVSLFCCGSSTTQTSPSTRFVTTSEPCTLSIPTGGRVIPSFGLQLNRDGSGHL